MDTAALVQALTSNENEPAVKAIFSRVLMERPHLAPAVVTFACPELTYAPAKAMTDKRCTGFIKSYDNNTGCGSISCPDVEKVFGTDIFLHAKQMGYLTSGAAVSFAVVLNEGNKPQAYDVLPAEGSAGSASKEFGGKGKSSGGGGGGGWHGGDDGSWYGGGVSSDWYGGGDHGWQSGGGGKTGQTGSWKGGDGWSGGDTWGDAKGSSWSGGKDSSKGRGKKRPIDPAQVLGQFTGRIKNWNATSGYGFISCEALQQQGYQSDVFLHITNAGSCEVGQEVTFTAFLNGRGQPQAQDVQLAGGLGHAAAGADTLAGTAF